MKTSKVLRHAKENLRDSSETWPSNKTMFICLSVECAPAPAKDKARVRREITRRIAPHRTAEHWLAERVGAEAVFKTPRKAFQAWRHAWVDQLIAEFEAKGD